MSETLSHMRREIKGIIFPYPVAIAGGVFKTEKQLRDVVKTEVIPSWGSIETDYSTGNGGRDYYAHYRVVGNHLVLQWAQNCLGIPNPGMEYVEQHAPDLIQRYADQGKPLMLNVSGRSSPNVSAVADTLALIERAVNCGFPVIIVNGACPNRADVPILCQDHNGIAELFSRADERIGPTASIILWKVSAGMERPTLGRNVLQVGASRTFDGMVDCNTVPNALYYDDDGASTIATSNGLDRGGLSGPAILPLALDATQFSANILSKAGKVVFGCGGVEDAATAMKYFKAGASIVKLNTAFREANEDPIFIQDLLLDLNERLEQSGTSIPAPA